MKTPDAARKRQRGICDTCGETRALTPSGNVVNHKSPWNLRSVCKGSNRPPEAIVDAR